MVKVASAEHDLRSSNVSNPLLKQVEWWKSEGQVIFFFGSHVEYYNTLCLKRVCLL